MFAPYQTDPVTFFVESWLLLEEKRVIRGISLTIGTDNYNKGMGEMLGRICTCEMNMKQDEYLQNSNL